MTAEEYEKKLSELNELKLANAKYDEILKRGALMLLSNILIKLDGEKEAIATRKWMFDKINEIEITE